MQLLGSWVVGKPLHILAVAILLLLAYLAMRNSACGAARTTRPLLIAAVAWGLYASWEWLVVWRTPEADIRVDLLLIWPVVGILTVWAIYKALR